MIKKCKKFAEKFYIMKKHIFAGTIALSLLHSCSEGGILGKSTNGAPHCDDPKLQNNIIKLALTNTPINNRDYYVGIGRGGVGTPIFKLLQDKYRGEYLENNEEHREIFNEKLLCFIETGAYVNSFTTAFAYKDYSRFEVELPQSMIDYFNRKRDDFSLKNIRTTYKDDELKMCECEAFVNDWLDISYTLQNNSDGGTYIELTSSNYRYRL